MINPAPIKIRIPRISDQTDDLTVDLAPGEPLFVVGANGSGKSALLHFIFKNHHDLKTRWLRAIRSNIILQDQPHEGLTRQKRDKVDQDIENSLLETSATWAPLMEPLPQKRAFFDLIEKHKPKLSGFIQ